MKLWRITSRQWALDRTCEGARVNGGRWNPAGYPVMYAGTTIEICALEKFVHLAGAPSPPLVLVGIDVPDDPVLALRPVRADLPDGWADMPVSKSAQQFGRQWIASARHLMLLVPSVIIPEATNAVINPAHPAYPSVKLAVLREFHFDARMGGAG